MPVGGILHVYVPAADPGGEGVVRGGAVPPWEGCGRRTPLLHAQLGGMGETASSPSWSGASPQKPTLLR